MKYLGNKTDFTEPGRNQVGSGKHPISASRLIRSMLQGEGKEISVVLIYGLGVGILSLAIPVGIQTLVSTVNFGAFSQPVLFLILAVFIGLTSAAVLRGIQVFIVEQLQKRLFSEIALELAYRIPRLVLDGKSTSRFPDLVNRFFDVLTVQKSSAMLLLEGFALALQVVLGLVLLGFYHWFLLAFAIVMIASIGVILFLLGRGAIVSSVEESAQKYRVAAWLEDLAARPLLFRSSTARTLALRKADEVVTGFLEARSAHFKILMRQVLGSLALQAIASSALLGIGAYLVSKNQLTVGQLVAAEIVVTTALASLAKFQKHLEAFYDLVAALDKLEYLFTLPMEQAQGAPLKAISVPAEVEIKGLSYSYDSGEPLFHELNFKISSGSKVALLGANSSGKTTLVDLLYGIRKATNGALLIDGYDFRDLSIESVRDQVALVRGLEILPDSIFENVRAGRESVGLDEVRQVLSDLGLLQEIESLPEGLQTQLTGDGRPLSIAQAHRLGLARAIVARPRLLLVDETLDDLDEKTRERALSVILQKSSPWTLLITTHDTDLATKCDAVIALDSLKERRSA
ncbi:MAG: ABC transporter ATP-binding protein [Proteobacteria bacterium]|nr:ABC transporter ATP-binding protein [Pseudomonadota bacterium]